MGTTSTALAAGSLHFQWVIAIEGFPYLLTNGPTAAAVAAWAGTDWTQALGGLYVDLDRSQRFDPWNPFPEGGQLTLRVVPDPSDILGRHLHRCEAATPARTTLTASIDCNDTTISVTDTSEFAVAPAELWIGNECIEYSGMTGTTFTASKRGKYSPFLTYDGDNFGRPHRVDAVSPNNVVIEQIVTDTRRTWTGAKVGVWLCRDVGGTLDVRAQAQLVFAGEIAEFSDDAETGQAVIEVRDLLEIGERTLVRDQFKARIAEGMWIPAGQTISFLDNDGTTDKNADDLVCVVGASTSNEFEEGFYTNAQLASVINTWLAAEKAASRIYGDYFLETPALINNGYRGDMQWFIPAASATTGWQMTVPRHIAVFMGIAENVDAVPGYTADWGNINSGNAWHFHLTDFAPLRWYIPAWNPFAENRLLLTQQQGVPWDNYGWLPEYLPSPDFNLAPNGQNKILPVDPAAGSWGIFTLAGKPFVVGAISGNELRDVRRFFDHDDLNVRYEVGFDAPQIELAQVYVIAGSFADIVLAMFNSTGTSLFNDPAYDVFPQALGLAVPGELLHDTFADSVRNAPYADHPMMVIVDKPLTLTALIGSDVVLRGMHLVWRRGGFVFRQWGTPLAVNSVATLTEANKAMPARQKGSHRSATTVSRQWLAPIVKIMFARDWTSDQYTDGPLVLEDRGSVDDLGGDAPERTIRARNMSKDDVELIAPLFLERMPTVSRPTRRIRRTINQTLYETLSPGDAVLVSDGFARDPTTGARGLSNELGLVVLIDYSVGGAEATNPIESASQVGQVEILVFPGKRFAAYCPAAKVDETVNSGGFTAGYNSATKTLRMVAHEFSESVDQVDASRFVGLGSSGDDIEIIERDPANPSSPITWQREIISVSGSDITLDTTLSSPSFDSAKQYYVRSRQYSAADASQQVNVYMADANGRIESDGFAYHYAGPATSAPYTPEDDQVAVELIPEMSYGDGAARDVAEERAAMRLLNGLMDWRTAHQSPVLFGTSSAISAGTGFSGYRMLMVHEKYFGRVQPFVGSRRFVTMAPRFRSADGSSATVRITLTKWFPIGATDENVVIGGPMTQWTWNTSSTTWQDGTPQDFDLRNLGDDGIGIIIIEGSAHTEIRGLSRCIETDRR